MATTSTKTTTAPKTISLPTLSSGGTASQLAGINSTVAKINSALAGGITGIKTAQDTTGSSPVYFTSSGAKSSTGQAITPATLETQNKVVVPTKDLGTDTSNLLTSNNMGLANTNFGLTMGDNGLLQVNPTDTTDKNFADMMKLVVDNKPPSAEKTYNALPEKTAYENAQKEVQNYTGQINTIVNKAQADVLKNSQQSATEGGTASILSSRNAEVSRLAAIDALPIQSLLANAQGNLELAQTHLDTVFKLKMEDATNVYNYNTKLISSVYDYATKKEQRQFDLMLHTQDQNYTEQQSALKYSRDLATQFATNNDVASGAKIAKLSVPNIKSATFAADMATYNSEVARILSTAKPDALRQAQIGSANRANQTASSDTSLYSGLGSPVAKNPDGTYDTATQNAILAKMSPADAALVKAVGTYSMDISKVTSLRSDERQKLAAKVALVYPGFEMQNYATIAAYKKNLANTTQGSAGGAINSANKVINHLTSYIDNVSGLATTQKGGFLGGLLNKANNAILTTFLPSRQKQMAEAQTDATGVKDELAKFFKGSGVADVKSIEDWGKTVNVNASPAEQMGAVQGAIELLQGQLVPMMDQYKQTTGQEPPANLFLKADTALKLTKLKNEGFKIDIPGVYYTDKSAWERYGGGNEQALTDAYNQLKAIGLPTTPENILQAAQLQ